MPSKSTLLFVICAFGASLVQGALGQDITKTPQRVVAIGDVHGDLFPFVQTLAEAGLVSIETDTATSNKKPRHSSVWEVEPVPEWRRIQEDRVAKINWIGRNTVLVQTGDMLDRGPDTIAVYTLLRKLQIQAEKDGGAVVPLLGNHEFMRMYAIGNPDFDDYHTFGEESANRDEAFGKNGFLGKWLRTLDTVKIVGDTVYSHAGIEVEAWAKEVFKQQPPKGGEGIMQINEYFRNSMVKADEGDEIARKQLYSNGNKNPVSTRAYASDNGTTCAKVDSVLKQFGVKRMVIGHNNSEGIIRQFCGSKLFLIDVGLSAGMQRRQRVEISTRVAALEIDYSEEPPNVKPIHAVSKKPNVAI